MNRNQYDFQQRFTPELRERAKDIIAKHDFGVVSFTLVPKAHDLDLFDRWGAELKAFRDWMKNVVYPHPDDDENYSWEETDFNGVFIGFMCAKGVDPFDAHMLSSFVRYNLEYFDER